MRNNKNNIIFNVRNITLHYKNIISYLRILTGHLIEGRRIITLTYRNITLCSIILILSLTNIILCLPNNSSSNSVSALSYSTNIGIGFTFEPTLSISLSSNDLIIPNLVPGSSSDSNSINVSVATNAAYGYNLSANVGNSTYNNTNLNNISNGNDNSNGDGNVFSSIGTTANFSSLTDFSNNAPNNTWAYSYSLDNGSTWSSYSGLPLYSNSNGSSGNNSNNNSSNSSSSNVNNSGSKTLVDKYTQSEDTISFKIAAKASNTQPSGIYSNVINFNVISYASPMSLSDSYAYFGKELYHGYYKMQDMTTRICQTTEAPSELQVIDIRDDKVYWIAKLADNNCWMTQNLDLDLTSNPEAENYIALTSENTDLNDTTSAAYQDGYTVNENGIITWVPERDTIAYNNLNSTTWQNDNNHPYSYDYLDANGNPVYSDNKVTQQVAGNHGLSGNYYNWSAAIASNNSDSFVDNTSNNIGDNPKNSICPKGWRLPTISNMPNTEENSTNEFSRLNFLYNNNATNNASGLMSSPLYFVRYDFYGRYWSSTVDNSFNARVLVYNPSYVNATGSFNRGNIGVSTRCLAH